MRIIAPMRFAIADPALRRGLNDYLAIVAAELRSVGRLTRTWVFVGLGFCIMGTAYGYYSHLHGSLSFAFLSAGDMLPRFTTAYFNSYVLWFFMAATVFLAFDLRNRDERERVHEVLDSRAVSNVPVIGGRLTAIVLAVAVPLFGAIVLIQAVGTIGRAFGWPVDPLEPVATFTFFFVDAIPALILWCAIVCFLAVGLRNRLATAGAALVLLGLHMWSFAQTPAYLLPAVALIYIHDNLASDLAPRFADAQTYLQRGSMLFVATALVVWAAAAHQRSDGRSSGKRLLLGILLAALGASGIGAVTLRCVDGLRLREAWLASHQAVASNEGPIVEHLRGDVVIDPGKSLELDIEMRLLAPTELASLVFSFNPGLVITDLRLGNTEVPFVHEHGLLVVALPQRLAPDSKTTLDLVASGVPDPNFAYLDSAVDWRRESSRNGILWLGTAGGIFENSYMALMPALRWLPVPGPNLDGASRRHFPRVDLTVTVPDGWLVAGPGRRQRQDDGRYRFRPEAPVPQVGLFAARFERQAMAVAGVELELLLHPHHQRVIPMFATASDLIESRLRGIFDRVAELGIPYPYDGFSVVEVPTYLRTYGGGSRLDTAMALPGILLLREHGFPYADADRLDTMMSPAFPRAAAAFKVQWLEDRFNWTSDPGNAWRALSRNLLAFQFVGEGPGAHALDYICEELANEVFKGSTSSRRIESTIYTAHGSTGDAGFASTVTQMVRGIRMRLQRDASGGFLHFQYLPPSLWEQALGISLAELDLATKPSQTIRAFGLRGRATALAIFDALGRNRTAALLGELRRRHTGGVYLAPDFEAAASATGVDIGELVGDWLNETAVPGFLASPATVVRLADDEEGRPRYETRLHIRNDEPVSGLVRVTQGASPSNGPGEPIRIAGNTTVEVGMVTSRPPEQLWLEPYLSLNRVPVRIGVVEIEAPGDLDREPLNGSQPSKWVPALEGVVVDDLHAGFSVENRAIDTRRWHAMATYTGAGRRELDRGLPVGSQRAGEWTRATLSTGWGKYRHTVAGSLAGDGSSVATFATDLPEPGRWQLEYHVPDPRGPNPFGLRSYGVLGAMTMTLIADGREAEIVFDGASAEVGWNKIGEFEFTSTHVRLEVSNRTDGEMVVADAIRWLPSS